MAQYTTYNVDSLTGGTDRALDSISVSSLINGDRAIAAISGEFLYFKFNASGTDAENTSTHPYTVRPDDYSTAGTWDEQEVLAGDVVTKSLFDATTFLYATSDNTPEAKTPEEVLAILSGNAGAAFDFNSQNVTGVAGLTINNGGTIGQATGPLLTFNDTSNYLEIAGGKVGIGRTPLLSVLEVESSDTVVGRFYGNHATGTLFDYNNSNGGDTAHRFISTGKQSWTVGSDASNTLGAYGVFTIAAGENFLSSLSASTKKMVIGTNGDVGFGTITPRSRLNIADTGACYLDIIADSDNNSADTDALLRFFIDGVSGTGTQKGNIGYDQGNDRIQLGYSTSEHIGIDSSGIVRMLQSYSHDMNGETYRVALINDSGEIGYDSAAAMFFKSYTVSTQGLGSSPDIFAAGFCEAPATDANLTQASATVNYGTANSSEAAHAFLVAGGAGSVDAGSCSIVVSGTSITDAGVRTTGDSETIVSDITAMSTDEYFETSKKWLGQIAYTLTPSGAATYSADFNYGLTKYDDISNRNFTLTDIEVVGLAGANDANFDIVLFHHSSSGWTYSAAAFVCGGTEICRMTDNHSTDNQLVSGTHFAYKRTGLSTSIAGSGSEGFYVLLESSANNAVEFANIHVGISF